MKNNIDKKIDGGTKEIGFKVTDVVPFKPKPGSPFSTPGGWMDENKPKPENSEKAAAPDPAADRNEISKDIFGKPIKDLTTKELEQLDELLASQSSTQDREFYYSVLSKDYGLKFLKTLSLSELEELLQQRIAAPMSKGGLVSLYKKDLRKP